MERVKVGALVVIAAALSLWVARDWMPEAHAEGAQIVCNSWVIDTRALGMSRQMVAKSQEEIAPIRDWLTQNPGQPVYHSAWPITGGVIETMCVR